MNSLENIQVIEFEGLAPSVHIGMALADLGATVYLIRNENSISEHQRNNFMNANKKILLLDLKNHKQKMDLLQLYKTNDIILDCFRPGVLEKLGLGPQEAFQINSKIIFARISGYGQNTDFSKKAGHDINYLATSGVLSTMLLPPNNYLADFGGATQTLVGNLYICFQFQGILAALYVRNKTGQGCVVDGSLTQSVSYMANWVLSMKQQDLWSDDVGRNILDGGAPFYCTYWTKDGGQMAVGCLEPKFYKQFLEILKLEDDPLFQNQLDFENWSLMKLRLSDIFLSQDRIYWENSFKNSDCCVQTVLEMSELKGKQGTTILGQKPLDFKFNFDPILISYQQFIKRPKL